MGGDRKWKKRAGGAEQARPRTRMLVCLLQPQMSTQFPAYEPQPPGTTLKDTIWLLSPPPPTPWAALVQRGSQGHGGDCVLPLAGSGKIPWLLLLMTDDLGESWTSWEEPAVLGEECCEEGLEELWRPLARWWSPSLCSFRGSHRGTLSSWAVLDRSTRT